MFYIGRNMDYDKRLSEGCKIVLTIFMAVKKGLLIRINSHLYNIY